MSNFKTGDTIVAIRDSQISDAWKKFNIDKVYSKGDKFRVHRESIEDSSGMRLIIWHPILNMELEVNPTSFKLFKKIVYIDMDGVLCNYKEHFLNMLAKNPKIEYPQTQYGFYIGISEIEGAIEAYKKLEEIYDVWILTRPSWKNPLCYTEKRVWVEDHLSKLHCRKLIICHDKSLLKGDYLIDDNVHDFEGESFLFGSEEYPNWSSVLKKLI